MSKFVESMRVTYERWHDGTGYDLEALDGLAADEKREVEDLLVSRKKPDWRDIEALDHLGTRRALAKIEGALKSTDLVTRAQAAEKLRVRHLLNDDRMEALILDALDSTTLLNGMTHVLALAKGLPTPAVRKKVLSKALEGNDDIRVHAAALAHHLYGGTSHPFDMTHRPFYLRFKSPKKTDRLLAFRELCALIGVDAAEFDRVVTSLS